MTRCEHPRGGPRLQFNVLSSNGQYASWWLRKTFNDKVEDSMWHSIIWEYFPGSIAGSVHTRLPFLKFPKYPNIPPNIHSRCFLLTQIFEFCTQKTGTQYISSEMKWVIYYLGQERLRRISLWHTFRFRMGQLFETTAVFRIFSGSRGHKIAQNLSMVAVKKGSILNKACKLNRFICIQREVLFQEVIDTWFEYKLQEMHSSSNSFKRLMWCII